MKTLFYILFIVFFLNVYALAETLSYRKTIDYVDADIGILRDEIESAIPAYESGKDWYILSNENRINVVINNIEINSSTVNDVVILHGSQAQVDARAAIDVEYQTAMTSLLLSLKDLVNTITYDQIDTIIDNQYSDHTPGQRNVLKKTLKVVLYLGKYHINK